MIEIGYKLLKTKREYKDWRKQEIRYIYQNELDKACFQYDMAYGYFKDLPRKVALDKVLHCKAFNTVKSPKYYTYQHEFASSVYRFLIVKSSGGAVKSEIIPNQELTEELRKSTVR